jgi:hypothetical protein
MGYSTLVNYYRINANNTSIATSSSGASGSPNEEIAAPNASTGTFSSLAGLTVTGSTSPATDFDTAFTEGQYLYFIDNGVYVLAGQIDTITDFNTLDLVSVINDPATAGTPVLAASYSLVTTSESIYIRVATDKTSGQLQPGQAFIPLLSAWRTSNAPGATNNPAITKIDRVSNVGVPASDANPTSPVQFTLEVMNQFVPNTSNVRVASSWNNVDDIPAYIWLRAVMIGGSSSLSAQTMYRLTTEEYIEALTVTANYPNSALRDAGYFNVTTTTAGAAQGSGQVA